MQRRIDLTEIPRVRERQIMAAHIGLRRHLADVIGNPLAQLLVCRRAQQFIAVDQQVGMLAHRYARPPTIPALRPAGLVECCPQKSDNDSFVHN